MALSLKLRHLKRYKDIARLLMKYGRSDLIQHAGLDDILTEDDAERRRNGPPSDGRALADDLERMGPTFIKLGQLLSTRTDLLPPSYVEALARLQDKVEPFPYEDVEAIVSSELGARISKAFAEFERAPIAAASLAQVHRARLRDGRSVVVKVQRPNIRTQVVEDMEALEAVAEFLDAHSTLGRQFELRKMMAEFRRSLIRELDYEKEAANLRTLRAILEEFDRIVVPSPVGDYTTSRVLTMDYVRGTKITALTPIARLELDGRALADQLFHAYLRQILVEGFFHADPHPGNVFLTDDGRLALIDLGMVAHITDSLQDRLLQLLLAISDGKSDEAAAVAIGIGEPLDEFDEQEFRRRLAALVARQQTIRAGQMEVGRTVLEVVHMAAECHVRVPPELAMLGKTLLNLDQVGRTLDPTFDPNAAIRRYGVEIMQRRLRKGASSTSLLSGLIDMKDFVAALPLRLNKILDRLANNDIAVKVDAFDERRLLEGLQKIANRITMGLVLAALVIGAAMLMSVPTDFRLFGYPGLAMILFMAAAGGGVLLVATILLSDVKPKKK